MNCQGLISVKIVLVCEGTSKALLHFFKSGCLFCHNLEGQPDNGENGILLWGQLVLHWLDKHIVNFVHCQGTDFARSGLRLGGGEVFVNIHFSIVPCA